MLYYDLTCKQVFVNQLRALPSAEMSHVTEKVRTLQYDPTPDAKNKKQLDHVEGRIFRIRSGDYRVLYTYGAGRVSLLGVGHRSTVYDGINQRARRALRGQDADAPVDLIGTTTADAVSSHAESASVTTQRRHGRAALDYFDAPQKKTRRMDAPSVLPQQLDAAFLRQLRVSDTAIPALLTCVTVEDLCAAPISEADRGRVFDAIVAPDYLQVLAQPDLRLESPEDIQRLFDGDLITTLLRLDPEQEKLTRWGGATGPTLFRGGPGTGKSVVAIYRVRSLVEQLRRSGVERPRILFTTYTNSLRVAAQEQIKVLLRSDVSFVDILTTDSVVSRLYGMNGRPDTYDEERDHKFRHVDLARKELDRAADTAELMQSIKKLSLPFVVDEIDQVIVARDIDDEDDYLTIPRAGRRRLNDTQLRAIWRIHSRREETTARDRQRSIAQWRRDALRGMRSGWRAETYDGVVIDEAQDLDPTVIRLLVELAPSVDRLCLTADSNQCIYGNGFRWQDVHHDLKFRGRATVLRRSYRSTQQIVEAANAYLRGAEGDEEDRQVAHVRSGPKPVVIRLRSGEDESTLIVDFILESARTLRVGLSSCAVLVDSWKAGQELARRIDEHGIACRFMASKDLDLNAPVVKVTTFKAAKGLEFPVVAIAAPVQFQSLVRTTDTEEREEAEIIDRRTMYVAMTRAMYALTVLLPAAAPPGMDDAFPEAGWHQGAPESWANWVTGVSITGAADQAV